MRNKFKNHHELVYLVAAIIFTALVFILELWMPLGTVVWLLFILPLLLTSQTNRPRYTYFFTAICTVLIVLGFFYSPPGATANAIFNRSLGIFVLWSMAVIIVKSMKREELLRQRHG